MKEDALTTRRLLSVEEAHSYRGR